MNTNIEFKGKQSGIYKITNKVSGKSYIGQSVDVVSRKRSHLNYLRRGNHQNIHLQNAWDKNGEQLFSFELLNLCGREELDEKEKFYIDSYNTIDRTKGYNMRTGGMGNWKVSKETGRRISETKISNGVHNGERNSNALFSNKVAKKIIVDLLGGKTREYIVSKYNIPVSSVNGLVQNRTYVDVMVEVRDELRGKASREYKERKNKAVEMYLSGVSQNETSKRMDICRRVLSNELKLRGIDTKKHKN